MKGLGVWVMMSITSAVFWVFSVVLIHWFPGRIVISLNERDPSAEWPGTVGFLFFPAVLTIIYAVISILLYLHNKKRIKFAYDEVDPQLSRSLLALSFFSTAGILFLGEISLIFMNR